MTLDERLREELRARSLEPARSLDEALPGVIKRGRRKRALNRAAQAAMALAVIAIAVTGVIAVRTAPETGGFVAPADEEIAGPSCGRYNARGNVTAVALSADGRVVAFRDDPAGLEEFVVVCSKGEAFSVPIGRDPAATRAIELTAGYDQGIAITRDGSRIFFDTRRSLTPDDQDREANDVYSIDPRTRRVERLAVWDDIRTSVHVPAPLTVEDIYVGNPILAPDGMSLRFTAYFGDGNRPRHHFERNLSTGKTRALSDEEARADVFVSPGGRFSAKALIHPVMQEEWLRDSEARARGSIAITNTRTREVRRIDIPTPPRGTHVLSIRDAAVSADGMGLAYMLSWSRHEPLDDGTLVRPATSRSRRLVTFGTSETRYEIGESVSAQELYVVDFERGTTSPVSLTPPWVRPNLAAASADLSVITIRANWTSERPRRTTSDLLLYEPRSGDNRVLSWHPNWLVRHERALLIVLAGALSLLGLALWSLLVRSDARSKGSKVFGTIMIIISGATAWDGVFSTDSVWDIFIAFAGGISIVEAIRPGGYRWLPFRLRVTAD